MNDVNLNINNAVGLGHDLAKGQTLWNIEFSLYTIAVFIGICAVVLILYGIYRVIFHFMSEYGSVGPSWNKDEWL